MKKTKGKRRKVKILGVATLVTCAFSLSTATAQTSVNATGGDASGSGGSANYSAGQVVYTTNTGTNGSVAEGVQQPYEISVVTGIEETTGINLSVSAYPNPTTDFLQLKVESEKLKDLSYQLYNMQGKLLQTKDLIGTETQIDMSNYVPSTYFVRVISGNNSIKEFKIIKQ
ncbi:MAG: T9SS type A sorting domain-containing protein [Bacteroidota bacterium]